VAAPNGVCSLTGKGPLFCIVRSVVSGDVQHPTDASSQRPTNPDEITAEVIARLDACEDERLATIMRSLVMRLHGFVREVELTEGEWRHAIRILTATGEITDERRQEWILWSDALGVSMLIDAIGHQFPETATESTVLGPFYVPNAPQRPYGAHLDEVPADVVHSQSHIVLGRALTRIARQRGIPVVDDGDFAAVIDSPAVTKRRRQSTRLCPGTIFRK